jgi:Zn finger protein HypA/HybF involved in hydrogenase expression
MGRTAITALSVAGFILACICIFFGVLFIWGAFSPQGDQGWIVIGVITVGIGLVIIALGVVALVVARSRATKEAAQKQEIVQKIDLSGDIAMEKLKCQECAAELEKESISVKEGAIFINCPYCGSIYQVVEEPKW